MNKIQAKNSILKTLINKEGDDIINSLSTDPKCYLKSRVSTVMIEIAKKGPVRKDNRNCFSAGDNSINNSNSFENELNVDWWLFIKI